MLVSEAGAPVNAGKVIDKHAVAVSFSRAANTYDGVAHIQRWVIDALLKKITANTAKTEYRPEKVLDIGCGTGHLTLAVAQQLRPLNVQPLDSLKPLNSLNIVGLDIAEGMVAVANKKLKAALDTNGKNSRINSSVICGDAEAIPFVQDYFSLMVSSFALQWCPDLNAVFKEVHRTLMPEGRFYFALPVGDTLKELKHCWQQVDADNSHVNDFYQLDELNYVAAKAGFTHKHISVQRVQEHYQDLKSLTHALKSMGAHNVTQGRARQLTARGKIQQLKTAYECHRQPQGLPVTWDVAFGVLVK